MSMYVPVLKHKEFNSTPADKIKGHGKYINIQENLPKLGKNGKQLTDHLPSTHRLLEEGTPHRHSQ